MKTFRLSAIPSPLSWRNDPVDHATDGEKNLVISSGEKQDWFLDPAGTVSVDNAPAALFLPPDREFTVSAFVRPGFAATYDAGVIHLRTDDDTVGSKLCFEFSPQAEPMVVSVVMRGVSDDCNSAVIGREGVYLRVTRRPPVVAFHYSLDGGFWHFVRYFTLGDTKNLYVGFSSQSPVGRGCTTRFTEITYRAGAVTDFRNGE